MERGSWLWRRRSSEKNPCETESSGSTSSPSERYSDDQVCPNLSVQSAEVSSSNDDDEVKTLTEKLSAALSSINEKEALINQHTKVAEEAVSGWEKAEGEVVLAKQQVEVSIQKNAVLEGRVLHLDEALKECVKQLRQTREEQEEKIREAISVKSLEWRQSRSELVIEVASLKSELRASSSEALKAELQLQREKLRRRTVERDLSVRAAEAASKQYLESMKKAARLESECRRLKSVPRKPYDQVSSTHVESIDSRSDSGEVDDGKASDRRSGVHRTVSFSLMDDFLEMEKFAESSDGARPEIDMLLRRIAELERSSAKVEAERHGAERDSVECRHHLETSKACLNDMEAKLVELQKELDSARERNSDVEEERDTCLIENQCLLQRINSLTEENIKAEGTSRRCRELDGELSRLKLYIAKADVTSKAKQEEGRGDAARKLAVCQETISSMGRKIRSLAMVDDMEDMVCL